MYREIKTNSLKARELMAEGKELSVKVANMQDEIEVLQKEQAKWGMKYQKIKDKLEPIKEELVGNQIGEFETVINLRSGETEEEVIVDIVDRIEQFKDAYRNKKPIPEV